MSISDESLAWLKLWMGSNLSKLAAVMVLMDMLPFKLVGWVEGAAPETQQKLGNRWVSEDINPTY